MTVFDNPALQETTPRSHPWTEGAENLEWRYEDFKSRPELIPVVLEDFKQYADRPAIITFYDFLRWINGPESQFETNDCAFRGPRACSGPFSHHLFACDGRVCVLFRTLKHNVDAAKHDWLFKTIAATLDEIDPEFPDHEGRAILTLQPTDYLDLAGKAGVNQIGKLLMVTFVANGDSSDHAFANLDRVFHNMWKVFREISRHIPGDS